MRPTIYDLVKSKASLQDPPVDIFRAIYFVLEYHRGTRRISFPSEHTSLNADSMYRVEDT